MNRFKLNVAIVLSLLVIPVITFANALTGLKANPTTDRSHLNIAWDAGSGDTMSDMDGYAIQWSVDRADIHINKRARLFTKNNDLQVRLPSFERGTYYYFRIYTYKGNKLKHTLSNGSKILKWRLTSSYNVETEEIAITDPVIVNNTSTTTVSTTPDFEFGMMRVLAFDNFADLSWTTPTKMAKSDYDGFEIMLSLKSDMSDPIKTFKTNRSKNKVRVKGLSPDTKYYTRGAFYKDLNGRHSVFGNSPIKTFTTIPAIDRSISTRKSRNLAKIEKRSYFTVTIGETETTTSTTTNSTTSTTTSSSSTSIRTRIADLKRKISELQRELRSLESQVSGKKTGTKKRTRTTSSAKKLSLRERLKARLAKKRR